MARSERRVQEFRSLWVLLIAIGMLAGVVITSCGGSGGGSDGELCNQCGDDPDGPCRPSIIITAVVPDDPNDRVPRCTRDIDPATGTCTVELACRRKVDSSQRRCFPLAPGGNDVDYQFRCDGSRPGGTPRPQPTPTLSPTPETTAVPQTCNNSMREGTEECDSIDLGGQSCETLCNSPGGFLSCRVDCTFSFDNCLAGNAGCSAP